MTAQKKQPTNKDKEESSKTKKTSADSKTADTKKSPAKKASTDKKTAQSKTVAVKKVVKTAAPAKKSTSKKSKEEEADEEEPRQRKSFFTPASQVVKPAPVPEEAPAPAPVVAQPAVTPVAKPVTPAQTAPAVTVQQPKPAVAPQQSQPAPTAEVKPQAAPQPAPAVAPKPAAAPQQQTAAPKIAPSAPAQQPQQTQQPRPQYNNQSRPNQPYNQNQRPQGGQGRAQNGFNTFNTAFRQQTGATTPQQPQQTPSTPRPAQPSYQKPGTQQYNRPQGQQYNKNQPKPQPKPVAPKVEEVKLPVSTEKIIKIVGTPTVKELAEKMEIKIPEFIKKLMGLGIFATINQRLETEIIELVVSECGFKADMAKEFAGEDIAIAEDKDNPEDLRPRAPVVTIMGHVDHGKTSLLDAIRKSNVVEGEHGAITQHIGAYRVKTPKGNITFLDTPGHEAFTAMRARGAQATDIVILVVSATDGIMPQTIEAMDHAKAAGAPIIVAVNKIDLPGANPDKVKQELASRGLVPEDWQGTTIYVEISAKKRINIDKLLEMVSLQAEMLELKANPNRRGVGVILESKRDNKRGIVATVLVQKGTIKVGDPFIVGTAAGKVRALIDENSVRHQSIGPGVPAEILGINGEPPHVGDTFYIAESEREAKHLAEKRKLAQKEDSFAHKKHISLMSLKSDIDQNKIKKLQIVLKGDVQGSLEAIKDALGRIPSEEVELQIIHTSPGNINESDILLAKASNAVVIGFNIEAETAARAEAEREGIEIRLYNIIFELIEDIRAAMEGLLEPDVVEVVTGRAVVRQVFNLSSGIIAGSMVETGKITRGNECKVYRASEIVFKGRIGGLKRFKEDVKEVEKGYECGILLDGFKAIKEGDVVETFRKDTITRRLEKSSN